MSLNPKWVGEATDADRTDEESGRPTALGNQHLADLKRFREEFTDRRTVPYDMVRHCMNLSAAAVLEERRVHEAAIAPTIAERDRAVARAEHYERLWRDSHELVDKLLHGKATTINVADRDNAVNVVVKAADSGWTLERLEDAVYQLRMAGGADDLVVALEKRDLRATMPDRTLALTAQRVPEQTDVRRPPAVPVPEEAEWRWPVVIGVVAIIMLIGVALGIVVGAIA